MIPQRTRRRWENRTALEVNGHRVRSSRLCDNGLGNLRTSTEKGAAEDELVGWYHRLNGHEFQQTLEIVEDRGAWHAAVHGVAKSCIQFSN